MKPEPCIEEPETGPADRDTSNQRNLLKAPIRRCVQHVPDHAEIAPHREFQLAAERGCVVVGKSKATRSGEIGAKGEIAGGRTYADGLYWPGLLSCERECWQYQNVD